MYRILIVDDEKNIVSGLAKMVSEIESYEFDIYRAYSGKKGLEIAEKNEIDIVLTDIHMPGMDGLVMADRIALINESVRIIFLTGFNEFDYIYTAIEREGNQYVLKSEEDSKIIESIANAIDSIEQEKQNRIMAYKADLEGKKSNLLLKKEVFETVLDIRHEKERDLEHVFNKYRISLDLSGRFFLFVVNVFLDTQIDFIDRISKLYRIGHLIDKGFEGKYKSESTVYMNEKLVWLLQGKNVDSEKVFRKIAEEYQEIVYKMFGLIVSVGFTVVPQPIEMLPATYQRISLQMSRQNNTEIPMIYKVNHSNTSGGIVDSIYLIQKLEKYINDHMDGDISLTKLAEVIHFNASYLSRFYRNTTGKTLSQFIKELKMSKSKVLLTQTNKSISEISQSLGFETTSSFCSFFRKVTGSSPGSYRNGT